MTPIRLYDDEYSYPLHTTGTASTLPAEYEDDTIKRLHAVVKEITGKDVAVPEKRRMGFLP
jgi:hypothetical protein